MPCTYSTVNQFDVHEQKSRMCGFDTVTVRLLDTANQALDELTVWNQGRKIGLNETADYLHALVYRREAAACTAQQPSVIKLLYFCRRAKEQSASYLRNL